MADVYLNDEMKSQLSTLLIKDSIRSVIDNYSLLLDGGEGKANHVKWVETIFKRDAILRVYLWDGSLVLEAQGREAILRQLGPPPVEKSRPTINRHFQINTAFDEITPTCVKTRTVALELDSTRAKADPSDHSVVAWFGGSIPSRAAIFVYHDTWIIEDGDWKKSLSEIRFDSGVSK